MPRILVTGAAGQLGRELATVLAPLGDVVALDRSGLDLARPDDIVAVLRDVAPALVVNAAAYTAVDRAEAEPEAAFAVNARAPGILAAEARRLDALVIHYSTDYVFDGASPEPRDEAAPARPLNVYGASKLEGERAIEAAGGLALVFRTSWVYAGSGRNFLTTIERLAAERDELRIVDDQHGTPNWSRELARATATLVARGLPWLAERRGLYHLSARGATTWYGFARAILGDAADVRIVPIASADHPTPARRPAWTILDTRRFTATFGFELPQWLDTLREYRHSRERSAR
ncbi:MAG TPA: dTDP-4-dehydrorhamnose reductase [Casimicrobiaceae bacterium]|nr:dTDP-4-dehydrorhamnose reductase [Casimicrobiaceae bacterium]